LADNYAATNATQQKRLAEFFGYLLDAGDPDLQTEKQWWFGKKMVSMFAKLVADGVITQEQSDEFFELGGGRPWADETEQTIATARVAKESKETFDNLYINATDTYLAPAEITGDKATLVTAFRDAADWLEAQ